MDARAARVKAVFEAALELERGQRPAFVETSCRDDTGIRREVEVLLAFDESPDARVDEAAPEALSLAGPLLRDGQLGPYRLKRCLAVGGMGAVYEAVHGESKRTVALKILRGDLATDELRHRFRVEFGFLARLQHPAIAHVYEADVVTLDLRPVPYMAMELVPDARSITAFSQDEGLEIDARVELFVQVCDAVHHGHQRGVIHRDLKPANILVDGTGAPKLIDFGVARAVDPEGATRRTEAGVLLGTVQYMSPEQCADARDLDVRTDVYSLGVVLYELLCGRLPYDLEGAPLPMATRIVQEREPRRPSLAHGLGRDLEVIQLKALEKDRARRYQSVAELADDLRRCLRKEPIEARAPSVLYRLGLFARRHKALAASLVTVIVVAQVSALAITRFAFSEQRARVRQEYSAYLANISAAEASLRVYDAAGARRRLARVPPEQRGWEWAHLDARLDSALRAFPGPLARCKGVAWREGVVAALWESASTERSVVLLDAQTGAELARHEPGVGSANGIAFTPGGRIVWDSSDRGDVRLSLWEPAIDSVVTVAAGHAAAVSALHVSPAGILATASADGTVRLRNAETLEACGELGDGSVALGAVALSADGRLVAAGAGDGSVRLFRGDELVPTVYLGHQREVLALAFDADGRRLASGSADGTICLWDVEIGRLIDRLVGHASEVRALRFRREHLVSASHDGNLRVWNTETGVTENVLYGHENWVTCLAISTNGELVVSGAYDGSLRFWDPLATPGTRALRTHTAIVRDLAFSPDGGLLATASRDGTTRLLVAGSEVERTTLAGEGGRVWAVAFHPDGELVATGADDGLVRIWGTNGELREERRGHTKGVSDVAFSPDGSCLASASWDGQVFLWEDREPGRRIRLPHDRAINRIAFHPSGKTLASVDQAKTVRLWDVRDGRELWQSIASTRQHDVAFSPDGRTLATAAGDIDGTRFGLELWDARTGEPLRELLGHKDVAYGVAFSPDGARIASASADGTVRLWDAVTGEEMLVLRGHESWVWSVTFSPDGTTLASGSGNYEGIGAGVRIWTTATE